jgi:energy-coupling factor transport system permease protein
VTFLLTALADDLLEALIARGASHRIAFVVLSAVQMVPRLQARAGSILEAQQARGLAVTGSFVTRIRALVPLVGPVLLGSLIDVRERTFALEARGFGARPDRTAYRIVADTTVDRVARLVLLVGIVAVVVVAVLGILPG